jgi:hypothetical protein
MLHIVAVQSTVQDVESICLLGPVAVLAVLYAYVLNPRKERMTKNKTPLDNWIDDIVAFHKSKRKFVSLKDMETEDADQFLICEFNGYDFGILAK